MRLKRLTCRGFKSFADKTAFEFDSALTGIIGPNGCGKSNVVDALKWVLGDQRAKSLRGQEMTDVIFKGAQGRDALGMAEVIVTLETDAEDIEMNAGGALADAARERSEISIGRRLTLDKESTYLLNGDSVRLKDVRDVLMDTGLGVGAYSVMEQGRIDAVLSANPESRRAIFEEAAGISRFKLQKRESLRKLERTETNLSRVKDLIEERSRRIRSLKVQAGKARRYKEIKARLRDLKSAVAVLDGRSLRIKQADHAETFAAKSEALAAAEERFQAASAELATLETGIAAQQTALEELRGEERALQSSLESAEHRAVTEARRAAELLADADGSLQQVGVLRGQETERTVGLTSARELLVTHEESLVGLGKQLEEHEGSLSELRKSRTAKQTEREALRESLLECIHERTRTKNRAHDEEAQLRGLAARKQRFDDRTKVLGDELEGIVFDRDNSQWATIDLHHRARILSEREARALADLDEADSEAAVLATQEAAFRGEHSQITGRLQALVDMEAHMEGLDKGPRQVLEEKPEGLRGRLLDLIDVDVEYGVALEAALGPYVQALVVDTRAHAAEIIRSLEERKLGRVLLLVEEEFGEELERLPRLPTPNGTRYLRDFVRETAAGAESTAASRMVNWLLRGMVLVEDIESARADRADLCFVTRDGAVLCGPRFEGGATEGQAGLVVRRSRIHELEDELARKDEGMTELMSGKDVAKGRVDRLKQETRAVGQALAFVRTELGSLEAQFARLDARCKDLESERAELDIEEREVRISRARGYAQLSDHLFSTHLIVRREQAGTVREADVGQELDGLQKSEREAEQAAQQLRVQQVQCRADRDGQNEAIRVHDAALVDLVRALTDLGVRETKAREGAQAAEQRRIELASTVKSSAVSLEAATASTEEAVTALNTARQERQAATVEVEGRGGEASSLREQLTELRLTQAETDNRFDRLEERLREETGVELQRLLGEVHGFGLIDSRMFHTVSTVGTVLRQPRLPKGHEGPPVPLEYWQADAADEATARAEAPGYQVDELQGPYLPPLWVEEAHSIARMWEAPEFDAPEARKESKLQQSHLDRLGAVNVDAVSELEREQDQFVLIEQEVTDLGEARQALMETLRRLEVESRALFERTFNEARENFQLIFRKLFQGGKADMYLADNDDALESGIEIMAKPPGKELQSINLLSGGERSMTALAILFAVFKVKPSPFCILDEVDAALDETNVERFLRVLRDFVGPTQFCIVTHHKRTMAECQMLYGITMQKRGVSSRIAVSLDQVDRVTESKPGEAVEVEAQDEPDPALERRIAGEEAVGFV